MSTAFDNVASAVMNVINVNRERIKMSKSSREEQVLWLLKLIMLYFVDLGDSDLISYQLDRSVMEAKYTNDKLT